MEPIPDIANCGYSIHFFDELNSQAQLTAINQVRQFLEATLSDVSMLTSLIREMKAKFHENGYLSSLVDSRLMQLIEESSAVAMTAARK